VHLIAFTVIIRHSIITTYNLYWTKILKSKTNKLYSTCQQKVKRQASHTFKKIKKHVGYKTDYGLCRDLQMNEAGPSNACNFIILFSAVDFNSYKY
jgi:hypothetical protein